MARVFMCLLNEDGDDAKNGSKLLVLGFCASTPNIFSLENNIY
jgi:hypothetical protein